ncbi:MAG: cysteine synthase A [Clostridia bacterium]|nr:cysteine synthase A [Clostridia bacterium]
MAIYSSVIELIGKTPLVRLAGLESMCGLSARLYGKIEYLNPAGSVKDRAALYMIEQAEREGKLKAGATVIEPTSGNTGIGLAMVCALKNYRFIAVMPETMSVERRKLIAAYGAEIVLTDGKKGMTGAVEKAEELCKQYGGFIPNQFSSEANALAHYQTTAPEIFEDLPSVDCVVCGVGSGGTVTGIGRYFKEKLPSVEIVAVEPSASPVLSGGEKGAHKIEGIGAGFVPQTLDTDAYTKVMTVPDHIALTFAQTAAKSDGAFVGISSGAAIAAAVKLAKEPRYENKNIVVVLPDGGGRYLSTELVRN